MLGELREGLVRAGHCKVGVSTLYERKPLGRRTLCRELLEEQSSGTRDREVRPVVEGSKATGLGCCW